MRRYFSKKMRRVLACAVIAGASLAPAGGDAAERTLREIGFAARDGRELRAVISMPPGKGPFPVVVTVHGGQGDRPLELLRQMAVPDSSSPTVQMLNRSGAIIFAPGYRNDWFGAEETDLVDAIRYAASLPEADAARVGVLGGSNGGRLALRAAVLEPQLMKCVAAGSPFLANMQLFFDGDTGVPPWSDSPAAAQRWMGTTRGLLQNAVSRAARRDGVDRATLFARHSAEDNAAAIVARVLLLTSKADEQVPHVMLQGLIDAFARTGRPPEILTVERSLHGFYWGRDGDFGARAGRGPKTGEQLAEEERVRLAIQRFFGDCLQGNRGSP
jgi:dipeptidyl aminopeptidase/acylaminoacyl peptidase